MDISFESNAVNGVEVVEAPHYPKDHKGLSAVRWFLAGGITGCTDWQAESCKYVQQNWTRFDPKYPLTVYNPRRESFDVSKKEESAKQIRWEHSMMVGSHVVSFWFCKDKIQPITLFELGFCLGVDQEAQHITIGIEPGYERELDVRVQTLLKNRGRIIEICSSLGDLLEKSMIIASKINPSYDLFN